ncbi:hypothetical protein BDV12DRAFT_173151 [Aspergillus spectabilis]
MRNLNTAHQIISDVERVYSANDSNGTESEIDAVWHSGDGVLPSEAQSHPYFRLEHDRWCYAIFAPSVGCDAVYSLDAFISLFRMFPPFFYCPLEGVNIRGGVNSPLVLRSSLHLNTTEDLSCNQR